MKEYLQKTFHRHHLVAFLIVFALLVYGKTSPQIPEQVYTADAVHEPNHASLHCWAWSPTIGWISFNSDYPANCPTPVASVPATPPAVYSVGYDSSTGLISGHAWSDTIGWLSFDRTKTGAPPTGIGFPPDDANGNSIARVDLSTGEIKGWARFLSACSAIPCPAGEGTTGGANSGGWDGWVAFNAYTGADAGNNVRFAGDNLTGYAWGGENLATPGNDPVNAIKFSGTIDADGDKVEDAGGVAYGVYRKLPSQSTPVVGFAVPAARDLLVKFVANRSETTSTVEVQAEGISNATFTLLDSNGNTLTQLSRDGKTASIDKSLSSQPVGNRYRIKLKLNGLLPTGIYEITVKAVDNENALRSDTEVVKLRVTNIVPGFGEN